MIYDSFMARSKKKSRITIRVGSEFKSIRKGLGFTQQSFGEMLYGEGGSSRAQMVSDLETGNRNMTLMELERLAGCVGVIVFVNFVSSGEILNATKNLDAHDKKKGGKP